MNIVKSIYEELSTAKNPVVKVIHKSNNCKGICIGFSQGMKLKEHVAHRPTTLLVLHGIISYQEGDKSLELSMNDHYAIPVKVPHAVIAQEESIILLIQG